MAEVLAILCEAGVVVDKGIVSQIPSGYMKSLIFTYFPRIGSPKRYSAYKGTQRQQNGREILIFPRSVIPILQAVRVELHSGLPPIRSFGQATIANGSDFLYEDQQLIIGRIRQTWRDLSNCGTACLNLRAGYGKTFIAAGVIALLRMRALYIVPTCELAKQVARDIGAALDGIRVIYANSGANFADLAMRDQDNNLVCVAVINTVLATVGTIGSLARYFSLVIFDEVHTYCSAKRMNVFWCAQARYMFGMSATIGERRDGFDAALSHHIPPLIAADSIEGFSYGENQFRCHVRAIRYRALDEYAQNLRHETTEHVFAHYMYEQFARDPSRNDLILREAQTLIDAGHNVFIFSEERAHVERIAELLHEAMPDITCTIFYGGISEEERNIALGIADDMASAARIIVATYSYSGTGVSIVRMTAMILATPRYSGMKQIVGRILRRGSDPAIPRVIVDIVDQKTCLARQFRLRRNAYNYYSATYEKVDVVANAVADAPAST